MSTVGDVAVKNLGFAGGSGSVFAGGGATGLGTVDGVCGLGAAGSLEAACPCALAKPATMLTVRTIVGT